jgi:hypothetical protein
MRRFGSICLSSLPTLPQGNISPARDETVLFLVKPCFPPPSLLSAGAALAFLGGAIAAAAATGAVAVLSFVLN